MFVSDVWVWRRCTVGSRSAQPNFAPPKNTHTPHTQNPFYEVDMPIRCELFQMGVERLVERNTRELRKARSGVDM